MAYVYICTHKITRKFYIGYRCSNLKHSRFSHIDLPKYKTSNRDIKTDFKSYDWMIIAEFYSGNDAYDFEQELINEHWNDPNIMNRSCFYEKTRFKSYTPTEVHKNAISLAQSKPKTNEHRKKLSEVNIGKFWCNDGVIQKQLHELPIGWVKGRLSGGAKSGDDNPMYKTRGKSHKLFGKKYKRITCPHCGQTGGENVMQRHHFDNCKLKITS